MLSFLDVGLHRLCSELPVEREMLGNFRSGMNREVAPWESFEEALNLRIVGVAGCNAYSLQQRSFIGCMQTIAIHGPAEEVGCRYEQLPQHLRLPRRERFRVDRVNIRIGHQAEPL